MSQDKKPREWKCQYNPETGELTYGYKHGCTDGFENIHVIEYSAYKELKEEANKDYEDMRKFQMKFIKADQELRAELEKSKALVEALEHIASEKTDTAGAYKMRALKTAREALNNYLDASCICGEINARHCPIHNENE